MSPGDMQRALDAVDRDAIVALAEELIKIPSFKTEETLVARFLADYLGQRGYQVQLQEVEAGRFQTVAILKGSGGGKSLMFNGHIDIDPLALGWKRDPWRPQVEGDRLYGAGIRNMKGGVAAMIGAAEAVRRSGVKPRGDIVIACVVGELQGGVGTTYLMEHGPRADMAVVTEPVGADNIATVHAGVVEFAVHTIGRSYHISRMEQAADALGMMLKAVPAIKATRFTYTPRADLPGLPRLNVGSIIGGRGHDYVLNAPNFTCDFCTALVDVRFLPGQTSESVLADVRRSLEQVKQQDPQFRYEIEVPLSPRWRAFTVVMEPFDLPRDQYILSAVLNAYRAATGHEPAKMGTVLPFSYSGDDTCHLWKAGVPCVLHGPGMGPPQGDEVDDHVLISQMVQVAKVLALTALDVCNLPK
ncbi:MAG: M20/M25/M40 family metallo-hydrolase [Chloroflexi bacterium]|nr:M20/M25/M40 family metallo-hydrolase [Chloroflexota bacterium]